MTFDGQFTLGVEEEFQIVSPETRELHSYISRLIEDGKAVLRERVRAEMHQSVVEIGTGICKDVAAVRSELLEMRGELSRLARKGGLEIVAASTHPLSDWRTQEITEQPRYHELVGELQELARANLIFGLHVHVGIKDKDVAIELANQVRYFLPHLLALTTSSPMWLGYPTGLASTRCHIFKRFPRTGIPDHFESYKQFQSFVELLVKTGCIDNGKRIWWDVRVHHVFDTVEVRVCDMPTNIDHTVAIVALVQALMGKLYMLYQSNQSWRTYGRSLIEEQVARRPLRHPRQAHRFRHREGAPVQGARGRAPHAGEGARAALRERERARDHPPHPRGGDERRSPDPRLRAVRQGPEGGGRLAHPRDDARGVTGQSRAIPTVDPVHFMSLLWSTPCILPRESRTRFTMGRSEVSRGARRHMTRTSTATREPSLVTRSRA
jgi:carboxylate-amine ligase